MRKKGKETLITQQSNAEKIGLANAQILAKLKKHFRSHQRFIFEHSPEFEIADRSGEKKAVHLVVLADLHCRNKEDYLFIALVEKRSLEIVLGTLKKGASTQKFLSIAWKEFYVIRNKKRPTRALSKSRIHVQEKEYRSAGIGTSLFIAAEEIRNVIFSSLARTLRIKQLTSQIYDKNGKGEWATRVIQRHFPYYVEQKESGLFEYVFRL